MKAKTFTFYKGIIATKLSVTNGGIGENSLDHFIVAPLLDNFDKRKVKTKTSNARTAKSFLSSRYRLEDMSADSLSSLLQVAIALTYPEKSYTFTSIGHRNDICTLVARSTNKKYSDDSSFKDNAAVLHILEREPGDYPINNRIYFDVTTRCTVIPSVFLDSDAIIRRKNKFINNEEMILYGEDISITDDNPLLVLGAKRSLNFSVTLNALQQINHDELRMLCDTQLNEHSSALNYVEEEEKGTINNSIENDEGLDRYFRFFPHKCDWMSQVAHSTKYFVVLVNIRPVANGHLMVVPRRVMPTIHTLTKEEIKDWGMLVHHCYHVLRYLYPNNDGICLAIQQGKYSGQTVPHLHTHLIVYHENGKLAGAPEEGDEEHQAKLPIRSNEEMGKECEMLRDAFKLVESRCF